MIRAFSLPEARALLERTPAVLDAWLRELPAPWLDATEREDSYSPREIVAHLIHGERTDWMARAKHILSGSTEPFAPFDRFAQRAGEMHEPLGDLLDTFTRLRAENLHELDALDAAGRLDERGSHPALGPVTLSELLATWVAHDQTHIAQIARLMAKRYRSEVGPWIDYLPLLTDRE